MSKYQVVTDDELSRELLQRYLRRRRVEISKLTAALEQGDFELIRRIGHNLYGSGDAYGLPRISIYGADIERAAERAQASEIAVLVAELERFIGTVEVAPPS